MYQTTSQFVLPSLLRHALRSDVGYKTREGVLARITSVRRDLLEIAAWRTVSGWGTTSGAALRGP
eukprot:11184-Eustigmatos_ZCMA.PRE.1